MLATAGRIDESKSVARRVLELEPTFHFRPLLETFFVFARPEILSAYFAGFRQAGLPE